MNNRVPEVFLSEMFGELRIMKDDNKFYFCAADIPFGGTCKNLCLAKYL